MSATVNGHTDLLSTLHAAGCDVTAVDKFGACALHYAAQMCGPVSDDSTRPPAPQQQKQRVDNRLDVLRRLLLSLTNDVDVLDQEHRTPLLWAASCGLFTHFCWSIYDLLIVSVGTAGSVSRL